MLHKRRVGIIEYLKENESATLDELCKTFNVSINTIRRDINDLEKQKAIKKVYGGVILYKNDETVPINIREEKYIDEKEKIGKCAADMVEDNDIIIIDAGSTTAQMIKYLKEKKNITIITNSINVVNESAKFNNINLVVVGGDYLRETNSMVGIDAINVIKKLNAKTAFIAATGISLNRGLSNSSMFEAEIKRSMIESADKLVLLADHTKFDLVSLVTFSKLDEIDYIITDKDINNEYSEFFKENNIELILAEE